MGTVAGEAAYFERSSSFHPLILCSVFALSLFDKMSESDVSPSDLTRVVMPLGYARYSNGAVFLRSAIGVTHGSPFSIDVIFPERTVSLMSTLADYESDFEALSGAWVDCLRYANRIDDYDDSGSDVSEDEPEPERMRKVVSGRK